MKIILEVDYGDDELFLADEPKGLRLGVGDCCGGGHSITLTLEEVRQIRNEMSQWIVIQEAKRTNST